jgi:hypothetical protein
MNGKMVIQNNTINGEFVKGGVFDTTKPITITFPALREGADRWAIYLSKPKFEKPFDNRKWHQKAIYKILMYLHNKVERFWYWSYYKSQDYAAPSAEIVGSSYYKIGDTFVAPQKAETSLRINNLD